MKYRKNHRRTKQQQHKPSSPPAPKHPPVTTSIPYTVQESDRAKHVRLRFSPTDGLVVVVPRGFDQQQIPAIVERKKDWIDKARQRAETRLQTTPQPEHVLPQSITMQAIGETRLISYRKTDDYFVSWNENETMLEIYGAIEHVEVCKDALRKWLSNKAYEQLVPWLYEVSHDLQISFNKAIVRGQKTRWASCSSKQTISLNRKLLFLPPHLVRYIFIHELCHLEEMNHSKDFWNLIAQKDPDYQKHEAELRNAARYVPAWV
jgi:hypothetical protein